MGCCGKAGAGFPKPAPCADGRMPRATPDALWLAARKGLDLCGRVGSGRDGLITKRDVEGW